MASACPGTHSRPHARAVAWSTPRRRWSTAARPWSILPRADAVPAAAGPEPWSARFALRYEYGSARHRRVHVLADAGRFSEGWARRRPRSPPLRSRQPRRGPPRRGRPLRRAVRRRRPGPAATTRAPASRRRWRATATRASPNRPQILDACGGTTWRGSGQRYGRPLRLSFAETPRPHSLSAAAKAKPQAQAPRTPQSRTPERRRSLRTANIGGPWVWRHLAGSRLPSATRSHPPVDLSAAG